MQKFFIGLYHPNVACHFGRSIISVNALYRRQADFHPTEWILDSGTFSQIFQHGCHTLSAEAYLRQIERWNRCGNLLAAVCQDWMCEPWILAKTKKTVREHQLLTVQSYLLLRSRASVPIMPVLQGFAPSDYVAHLDLYGPFLTDNHWVGVGSVCRRNANPDAIEDVLLAIVQCRSGLRLHGFGLKLLALKRSTVRTLLYSSDSMAWSFGARKVSRRTGRSINRLAAARAYVSKVEAICQPEPERSIQLQLLAL